MKKVAFHNLGCKVNAYETQAMLAQMAARGYEIVPFETEADIYVINTCTVTNIADRKSRQMLHKAKKKNPDALVVAVGCYVQADREGVLADEAVDLIVGNDQKSRLAELIETHTNSAAPAEEFLEYEPLFLTQSTGHTRAFLKIQDGCNQFCTYCLIPYVRGRVRSRNVLDILEEAKFLAAKGYREIVLTGIHLSSYGIDFEKDSMRAPLQDLILRLAQMDGIARIRLGSLEPRVITEAFVKAMAGCEKICPHFHLSLQSGCDETLKRMNRRYTTEEYYEKCELLRNYFSHPAITTDVIVGFPGETETEFQATQTFLGRVGFSEMHIFKYSRRKGTKAADMQGQVSESVKTERSNTLLAMGAVYSADFRAHYEGKEVELLLEEEVLHEEKKYLVGYTREYLKGSVEKKNHTAGDMVQTILKKDC